MEASYFTSISDEGSKIDLNDLGSESKKIAEITKKNLLNVFESQLRNEVFMRAHPNFRPEELVENITDWVDTDTINKIRGNEADYYSQYNSSTLQWPPNRAFRTLEELRFVAGVDESIFDLLKDRVTVFGMRAINPNHAPAEVIMSLDPSITKEIAAQVIKRRDNDQLGGPFKDGNDNCRSDFWGYVNSRGGRVSNEVQNDVPLACSKVTNFKIKSVGEYKGATREITAIVYDLKLSAQIVADALKKEAQEQNPNVAPTPTPAPGTPATPSAAATEPLPKGPPRIVYYNER
jgi:general secretion pathway protein K